MPLDRLDPTGEGTDTAWSLTAGASKTAAVTWPDDDVTTRINSAFNSGAMQSFQMGNLPSSAIAVLSHTVRMRWQAQSAPEADETVNMFLKLSGSRTHGTAFGPDAGWTTRMESGLAKPGGGAWLVNDVNSAELGVRDNGTSDGGGGGGNVEASTLSWEVQWSAGGGGFMALIMALGPLVAVGLHELPALALAVQARTRSLILPGEYVTAWRELREWRHPRHVFLGAR